MTKLVEILEPDGRVTRAEFPDDASDAEIEAALGGASEAHPSPPPPPQATAEPRRFTSEPLTPAQTESLIPRAGIGPTVHDIIRWALENPQLALEMLIQGGTTSAGIAAGTPAGPAGQAILGGLGSVAGKRIARDIGRFLGLPGETSQPAVVSGETALDFAEGALGPVASATARPIARVLTGTGGRTFEKARETAGEAVKESARKAAGAGETFEEIARAVHKFGETFDKSLREQALQHLKESNLGSMVRRGGELAGLGSAILGDPVTGLGYLLGGYALSGLQRSAALRLLSNEKFKRWLADNAPFPRAVDVATSLAALAADKSLTNTEKADIEALEKALGVPLLPDAITRHPRRRARDPKTGKFVKGGVDHSALEELFRGGP